MVALNAQQQQQLHHRRSLIRHRSIIVVWPTEKWSTAEEMFDTETGEMRQQKEDFQKMKIIEIFFIWQFYTYIYVGSTYY